MLLYIPPRLRLAPKFRAFIAAAKASAGRS
jgi:hypothetical protein